MFLQELTEKVKTLERGVCSTCSGKMSTAGKKRKQADPVPDKHINSSRIRLPSISSWLPYLSIEPNHHLHSPPLISSTRNDQQLPSPPGSTDFRPLITRSPPALTLPSPKTPGSIHAPASRPPLSSGSSQIFPGSAKTSPLLSPVHTAEDESAASVLLHISSSSYGSSSSSEHSYAGERDLERSEPIHHALLEYASRCSL